MKAVDVDLRKEVWKRLNSQLNVDVYKVPTLNAQMPYVVVGPFFDRPYDSKDTNGQRGRLRITIFSNSKDTSEIDGLKSDVIEALHQHRFDLSPSFTHLLQRYDTTNPQSYTEDEQMIHQYTMDFDNVVQHI